MHWDTRSLWYWMGMQGVFGVLVPPNVGPAPPLTSSYYLSTLEPNACGFTDLDGEYSRYHVFTCEKEGHEIHLLRNAWDPLHLAEVDIRVWDYLDSKFFYQSSVWIKARLAPVPQMWSFVKLFC